MRIGFISVFLLGNILAFAGDQKEQKEIEAITVLMTEFEAAMEARNVERLMTTLVQTNDLKLFLPTPYLPMLVEGTSGARTALQVFFQDIPKAAKFQLTHHQTTIQVHGDMALVYTYQNYYLNTGAIPRNLLSRTTIVLKKVNGEWRILHLHGGRIPEVSDYLPQGGNSFR